MEQIKQTKRNRPRLFSRDVNDVVRPIDKKLNYEKLNESRDVQPIEHNKNASSKYTIRASR